MQLSSTFKIIIQKGGVVAQGKHRDRRCNTFVQVFQGLQDSPSEGGHGVLHAGPQAEHALQVGLSQELLPVGNELRRAAEQGGHVVHELRHQAGVGIISLAVVISDNLAKRKGTKTASSSDASRASC